LPLEELERRAILRTLRETSGDKLAAARMLGIGKTTLYRKLKQYHVEHAEP
jgi:two-component system response regulator HydG